MLERKREGVEQAMVVGAEPGDEEGLGVVEVMSEGVGGGADGAGEPGEGAGAEGSGHELMGAGAVGEAGFVGILRGAGSSMAAGVVAGGACGVGVAIAGFFLAEVGAAGGGGEPGAAGDTLLLSHRAGGSTCWDGSSTGGWRRGSEGIVGSGWRGVCGWWGRGVGWCRLS